MIKMNKFLCFMILVSCSLSAIAAQRVLNVYLYDGDIPSSVIKHFERATGIEVNYATFSNNEVLYEKLKSNPYANYDVIMPSGYYVDRMRKEGMLAKIHIKKIANYKNIDPIFLKRVFDPTGDYSIPYEWGITGIFYNDKYYKPNSIRSWKDLLQRRFYNSLLMLNDPREVFSMALIALGYSANDENSQHIKKAFMYLKKLLPNIKVFNSDATPAIFVDENVNAGMAWNGDVFRGRDYNQHLHFVFPKDGYIAWVDCLAIPKHAPHKKIAYEFINFLLKAKVANQVTYQYGFATTNLAGKRLLPKKYTQNSFIYPANKIIAKAQFQKNLDTTALRTISRYWEQLKVG